MTQVHPIPARWCHELSRISKHKLCWTDQAGSLHIFHKCRGVWKEEKKQRISKSVCKDMTTTRILPWHLFLINNCTHFDVSQWDLHSKLIHTIKRTSKNKIKRQPKAQHTQTLQSHTEQNIRTVCHGKPERKKTKDWAGRIFQFINTVLHAYSVSEWVSEGGREGEREREGKRENETEIERWASVCVCVCVHACMCAWFKQSCLNPCWCVNHASAVC